MAGLLFFVAGTHGWITPLRRPVSTDFVSFYAAGRLADAGTPALVYDQAAHYAAEQAATEPGIAYNYFYYPPIFLLLCAVLARLPYLAAFVAFQTATLVPSLLVVRRILRERGWAILLPLLAFPPVFFTLGTGQNAFLTAALFGAATLLVDRRPVVAGMLFGALCYKPHFGLLVPVALVAAGRWRTVAAAAVDCGGSWSGCPCRCSAGTPGARSLPPLPGRTGSMRRASRIPRWPVRSASCWRSAALAALAYAAQAVVTAIMVATVFVWRRGRSLPVRAAILLAATPLAVPVALFYDLMLSGSGAGVAGAVGRRARLPGVAARGTVAVYVGALLTGNFGPQTHLVVTPLIAVGVFAMVAGAAWTEAKAPSPNPPPLRGRGG